MTGVGRKNGRRTGSFFMWGGITLYFCGHFSPDYFQLTHPIEDQHSGPPRGWRMSSVVRLVTVCPDTGESESGKADASSGFSLALLTCHQACCLIPLDCSRFFLDTWSRSYTPAWSITPGIRKSHLISQAPHQQHSLFWAQLLCSWHRSSLLFLVDRSHFPTSWCRKPWFKPFSPLALPVHECLIAFQMSNSNGIIGFNLEQTARLIRC